MVDGVRERLHRARDRLGRIEYRNLRYFRRRLEETGTLLHVSIVLFVPLLVGALTLLSNRIEDLSFFLFPPLAAGTYSLFHDPGEAESSPARFIAGLTVGAICAWIAIMVALTLVYPDLPPSQLSVDAPGAAFAVFLTGGLTWLFDVEEPAAFAVALLGLLVPPGRQFAFVLSVFLGSSIVAAGFYAWRELVYERRATYLYESTKGDDRVLVPMRGDTAEATAMLGARLAAAHDAGKVVLLDIVDEQWVAETERAMLDEHGRSDLDAAAADDLPVESDDEIDPAIEATADDLEAQARRIETRVGVPCQVIVAVGGPSPGRTVLDAATQSNCDLIAVPYETEHGMLTSFVRGLFAGHVDVLVHRSYEGRTQWRDLMVPVRQASDVAHGMIDFATRLGKGQGRVSVCHCIEEESRRRWADRMLAQLVETFGGHVETRIARGSLPRFLSRTAADYDMVFVGASRDRSAASRLIAPPTFERLQDLETDIAILDRH
jgi:hypothetical protein